MVRVPTKNSPHTQSAIEESAGGNLLPHQRLKPAVECHSARSVPGGDLSIAPGAARGLRRRNERAPDGAKVCLQPAFAPFDGLKIVRFPGFHPGLMTAPFQGGELQIGRARVRRRIACGGWHQPASSSCHHDRLPILVLRSVSDSLEEGVGGNFRPHQRPLRQSIARNPGAITHRLRCVMLSRANEPDTMREWRHPCLPTPPAPTPKTHAHLPPLCATFRSYPKTHLPLPNPGLISPRGRPTPPTRPARIPLPFPPHHLRRPHPHHRRRIRHPPPPGPRHPRPLPPAPHRPPRRRTQTLRSQSRRRRNRRPLHTPGHRQPPKALLGPRCRGRPHTPRCHHRTPPRRRHHHPCGNRPPLPLRLP